MPKQQRLYVGADAGTKGEQAKKQRGVELEVYNQGMFKTELCNKWEETGACPYGNQCQFAHGVAELRPVIRHPRYKTQVCRMVLAGEPCPYGHRCHFRHTLTPAERLLLPRP
jgi:butyrate response factor